MEKIFRGPCWSFVGFEAEVPNIGDFRTSWIGDTPIVVSRSDDNPSTLLSIGVVIVALKSFVNQVATRHKIMFVFTTGGVIQKVVIS